MMESTMKFIKYLIPFLIVTGFTKTSVHAQDRVEIRTQETSFERQLNNRDDQPVREFVQSKENIDVKEKASNLEISGDVRFEWQTIQEKGVVLFVDPHSSSEGATYGPFHQEYRALRGGNHVDRDGLPISVNDFDVEFNLKFKYDFKNAWAFAHLQFDNPAGVKGRNDCFGTFAVFNRHGSQVKEFIPRDSRFAIKGSGDGIFFTLKRAYIGYNVYSNGKHRFDLEIGRRKLDDIFESEIQFTSRFDGVLLKYASAIDEFADWYWNAGVFVIDERVNHFGWVGEIGLIDIMDLGLDLRYNFIDWEKRGRNRCFIHNPLGTRFQNSQVSLNYTIHPTICKKELSVEFYGGFLINHAAKKTIFTRWKKKNLGWYAGVYIGNVHKKGDWSLDIEYIGVQAQAVSEYDVGSIGRGNILNENLLDILDESFPGYSSDSYHSARHFSREPSSNIVGFFPRRGNTNFTGWRFEFLYAITDNFSIDAIFEFSNEEDRHIGGRHYYQDFELEAIYAF
jgi:hypothetical protein